MDSEIAVIRIGAVYVLSRTSKGYVKNVLNPELTS
jgi:hypothetical protein